MDTNSFFQMNQNESLTSNERLPLIISGPSGVGKGSIIGELLKLHPDKVGLSVSHTTRLPRPGEICGTHYHFVN
jgi:guanylate kinase